MATAGDSSADSEPWRKRSFAIRRRKTEPAPAPLNYSSHSMPEECVRLSKQALNCKARHHREEAQIECHEFFMKYKTCIFQFRHQQHEDRKERMRSDVESRLSTIKALFSSDKKPAP